MVARILRYMSCSFFMPTPPVCQLSYCSASVLSTLKLCNYQTDKVKSTKTVETRLFAFRQGKATHDHYIKKGVPNSPSAIRTWQSMRHYGPARKDVTRVFARSGRSETLRAPAARGGRYAVRHRTCPLVEIVPGWAAPNTAASANRRPGGRVLRQSKSPSR
jgi:hypothetical protein